MAIYPLKQSDSYLDIIRFLASDEVRLNQTCTREGHYPLQWATFRNHTLEAIKVLLREFNVDPNLRSDQNRRSPLYLAAGDDDVMMELLKHGASVKDDIDALGEAMRQQSGVLEPLLNTWLEGNQVGTPYDWKVLLLAATQLGDLSTIRRIMARYEGFVDGDYSDLALLQAVAKAANFRHADVVKLLMQRIESSARLHYRNPDAVFYEVFKHCDHETVQALLTRCSPNKLRYWKSALLQAAEHHSVQIFSTVLTYIITPLSVFTIRKVLGRIIRSGCLRKLSFMLRRLGPAEAMPSEFWEPEPSPLDYATPNSQPTYVAIRNGRLSMLKALLRWAPGYAHLNTEQGETLLSCAVLENQPVILRYLLSLGLDPTTSVVLFGITDDSGSDENQSLQLYACREGYTETLELLLAHGCDVNSRDYISSLNHHHPNPMLGATLLSWASHQGHIDCVRLLLAKGADIHAASETRYTALCCAARKQHQDIVCLLLEVGASATVKTTTGKPTIVIALSDLLVQGIGIFNYTSQTLANNLESRVVIADMLLESGSGIFDDAGCLGIEKAMAHDMVQIIQFYVYRNLLPLNDVYKFGPEHEGYTLLGRAAKHDACSIARLLVSAGCDVLQKDDAGKTALEYAESEEMVKIITSGR